MLPKKYHPVKTNLRNISVGMFVYVVSALYLLDIRGPLLPGFVGPAAELYIFPLRYMFRPLFPLLKPFGLVVSDGADLPTPYGIVVGSVIYVFLLLGFSMLLEPAKEKRRPYEDHWEG
jgi:hypothetical protein